VTYTVALELPVTVDVLDAVRGADATRATPAEPDSVDLLVRVGAVDVTGALPVDVLENLRDDALERLRRAAEEP